MSDKDYYKKVRKKYRKNYDQMPIEELDLSLFAFNRLKRNGISVYGEIRNLPDWKLTRLLTWNDKALAEVKQKISLFENEREQVTVFTPIETLDLDPSIVRILKRYSVNSVETLTSLTRKELLNDFMGIRQIRTKKIKECLADHGLSLANSRKTKTDNAA